MALTPRGIIYPTANDKIKDGTSPSALAADFKELADSTDAAIVGGVAEALKGTQLGSMHLDGAISPGPYYQENNADATTARGYPTQLAGSLFVFPFRTDGSIIRVYYPYAGDTFYKQTFYAGSFSAWDEYHPHRDTGWRLIDTSNLASTIRDPAAPGTLKLRRIENVVQARIEGLKLTPGQGGGFLYANQLPIGFRPSMKSGISSKQALGDAAASWYSHTVSVQTDDIFWVSATTSSLSQSQSRSFPTSHAIQGDLTWISEDTFPTTYPGAPTT